jgi:hypothetical protein
VFSTKGPLFDSATDRNPALWLARAKARGRENTLKTAKEMKDKRSDMDLGFF